MSEPAAAVEVTAWEICQASQTRRRRWLKVSAAGNPATRELAHWSEMSASLPISFRSAKTLGSLPVRRSPVHLPGDVVHGYIRRPYAHAPRTGARSQVPFDIQGIAAHQVRLENQRDARHSGVAHFA